MCPRPNRKLTPMTITRARLIRRRLRLSKLHDRAIGLLRHAIRVEQQRKVLSTGAELRQPGVVIGDAPKRNARDDISVPAKQLEERLVAVRLLCLECVGESR